MSLMNLQQSQFQTLQCGTTTFSKLTFDVPNRSIFLPTGRLVYVPLEKIVGGEICRLAATTKPHSTYSFTSYQQIITQCNNCTECPSGLNSIYAYLQRILKDIKVSLIVIIRGAIHQLVKDNESDKKIRFAFIDEEVPITLEDCQIVESTDNDTLRSFSKTSVLFVSISFIILMVISLAWLVFYYVQRQFLSHKNKPFYYLVLKTFTAYFTFRYAYAKDRLQRRLFNAAKKALTRIPTKSIGIGDEILDTDCPVCIDPYRTGDIVRSLPCRHIFHKTCVDPWLLEHRTCPMCKSDILKAFGYHISANRRAANNADGESVQQISRDGHRLSVDVHSLAESESAFPYTEHSETQDPFTFTPITQPQVVQVMHCSNANAFSIIPLTVHNMPAPAASNEESRNENMSTEQASVFPRRISWQLRRPSTAAHIINLIHVRSCSFSHTTPPSSELQKSQRVTSRSSTFVSSPTQEVSNKKVGVLNDNFQPSPSSLVPSELIFASLPGQTCSSSFQDETKTGQSPTSHTNV
ncbi:unnamed protein product [Thelazia callipaeda]|uniref:RING-type domain-containing protein n=1 Tax=Thelazia callipaeda TaxID=103827 RepID=A0A0N5CLW7_THECL|nr:unnamed protein product [Thelazia callipaeda]